MGFFHAYIVIKLLVVVIAFSVGGIKAIVAKRNAAANRQQFQRPMVDYSPQPPQQFGQQPYGRQAQPVNPYGVPQHYGQPQPYYGQQAYGAPVHPQPPQGQQYGQPRNPYAVPQPQQQQQPQMPQPDPYAPTRAGEYTNRDDAR
jgi:hypothetical protein